MTTDTKKPGTPDATRLGRALAIRSMVGIAGEFLPFVWPIRNFIHHNPLYGLEHLPFEEAVEQASQRFHARGYLHRSDYQALMHAGRIDPEVIEELIARFLHERAPDRAASVETVQADSTELDLQHILVTLMIRMDQPSVGNAFPSTDAILAQLRPPAESS